MYMYEGQDYSRASDKDRNTFDQLLTGLASYYQAQCIYMYMCVYSTSIYIYMQLLMLLCM